MEHFGLVVPVRGRGTYIVPALLALSDPDSSPAPQPGSKATPTATLHFALASARRPDRAPFWSDDDLHCGFLPDGAFHELCGTAVGWSNHTARRFTPRLGRGFAHIMFGKDAVLLERHESLPYATATLLNLEGDVPSAAVAAIERLRLLIDRVSERYANLRCTVLLPLADGTGELIERDALLGAEHDAELAKLAERLAIWLPPREPPGRYDASLSYRHTAHA